MDLLYKVIAVPVVIIFGVGVLLALTRALTTFQYYRTKSRALVQGKREPPTVPYWIPWLGSLLPFIFRQSLFLEDIAKLAQDQQLLRLRLGPLKAYIVTGSQNVQAIFRKSKSLSFELFLRQVMEIPTGIDREEIDLFFNPLKSDGKTDPLDILHQIHRDHSTRWNAANQLTAKFVEFFSGILEAEPQGLWREVLIYDFIRVRMTKASITALCGSRIFEASPNIIEEYWAWNDVFLNLSYGFPRFSYRRGYEIRDKLHFSTKRWLVDAWKRYDWSVPDVDWEENFGSRLVRAREKVFKESIGCGLDSRASNEMGLMFALNGNAVPATGWALLNLLERPEVFRRVYNEVSQVANMDEKSGKIDVDIPALMSLPWLLAVYTETLRLRVHFNVTREITQDIEIDGHILKAGHIVMAPTYIAHTLHSSWATQVHPAREFWPERFLVFNEKGTAPKFSAGEAGSKMFPYGGGIFLCPGRNFAKQEIMAAIAFMLLNFEFEILEYVKMDGSKSDRGPRLDEVFVGSGVTPPDRDIKVRLKKRG